MKKVTKKAQGGDTIVSKKERVRNGTLNRYKVRTPSGDIEQGKLLKRTDPKTGVTTVSKTSGIVKVKKKKSGGSMGKCKGGC